jgi:sigma-B regulation protein RsbU (phosphoserine phosphatase)
VLVLYTDGVTDSQDQQEIFFGETRLLDAIRSNAPGTAGAVLEGLRNAIDQFVDGAPQFDDLTLMVLTREVA